MGGSAASHNNSWQLFVRPTGTTTWRLATPPGVASNGGLVLAGLSSGSVLAGFRPSQHLTYSPFATTGNDGKSWSPSLLDASLADLPGAIAAAPGHGGLLAVLTGGTTEISSPAGKPWTRLATRRVLAASPAGTRCRPGNLTAVAFSPSGQPMLAAACARPGTAGIFTLIRGTWQLTGPWLPAQQFAEERPAPGSRAHGSAPPGRVSGRAPRTRLSPGRSQRPAHRGTLSVRRRRAHRRIAAAGTIAGAR